MSAREMIGVVALPQETPTQTAIRAAFRLGQERMRERCATHADTYGLGALAAAIRDLPVEE